MCDEELRIVRAYPAPIGRWDTFSFDRYDVCFQLSRSLTGFEDSALFDLVSDGVSIEGNILTIHNTTIEHVRDKSTVYTHMMAKVAEQGRAREAQAHEERLKEFEAREKETRRRQQIADSIIFD